MTRELDKLDPVEAMRSAWGTDALWELSASNSVKAVAWSNPTATDKHLTSGIEEGYQIVSFQLSGVEHSHMWLDGKHLFTGSVNPGSWLIVPAGATPVAETFTPFDIMHIYVPDSLLEETGAAYDHVITASDLEQPRLGEFDETGIGRAAKALADAATQPHALQALEVDARSQAFVAEMLLMMSAKTGKPKETLSLASINRLEEYFQSSLLSTPRLGELAAITGLSQAHFLRAFKTIYGRTPMREIQSRRLEQAAKQLRDTNRPISDIAAEWLFSDQSHFTRNFRARFGVTPAAYRKSLQPKLRRG